MNKERLEKGEPFADLEKMRIEILQEKIQAGLEELEQNKGQQWVELRLEKPLLVKLLSLISQAKRVKELEKRLQNVFVVTDQNNEIVYVSLDKEKTLDYAFKNKLTITMHNLEGEE